MPQEYAGQMKGGTGRYHWTLNCNIPSYDSGIFLGSVFSIHRPHEHTRSI